MKKSILFFVLLMITMYSFSQVTSGFKMGLSSSELSSFTFTDALDSATSDRLSGTIENRRYGYFLGFFVEIPLTESLNFQPEFMYVQQGSDREDLRIDYLQIPLGLKFDVFNKVYFDVGPQIGIRVWTPEDSGIINTFDTSVFGTLGYNFTENFFVEGRYTVGVVDIFQDNNAIVLPASNLKITGLEAKNSYFYIGFGYKL